MKQVFLIERSPDVLNTVKSHLRKNGLSFLSFQSVEEAGLSEHLPVLIVLFGTDNLEEIRQDLGILKNNPSYFRIPKILVLPLHSSITDTACEGLDVQGLFTTPVEQLRFQALVSKFLGQAPRRVFRMLLIAAVRVGNPVVMIEHRWLYDHTGHVPEEMYEVPLGKAVVRKTGKDATIVAVSHMVYESLQDAGALIDEGIDAEVIDLRTLKPLDSDTVVESVRKTGRLIMDDTGWRDCGVGSEVMARVAEAGVALKAPLVRVNLPEAPTPASPVLEKAYYPGKDDIIEAARKATGHGKG